MPVTDGFLGPDSALKDKVGERPGPSYPLAGPLFVEGAEPGDVLVVDILEIQHRGWGWTGFRNAGVMKDMFSEPYLRTWEVHDGRFAYMNDFVRVPIAPFCGTMGVAPAEPGELTVAPPRHIGGNMDIRHLTAGSTLYLPVKVEGALFSLGDGHLAQGDGEVCVSAIEGPLGATCRFDVIKGRSLATPQFETAPGSLSPLGDSKGYFVTMGVADDLQVATREAVRNMIDELGFRYDLSPQDAYILCSVAADLKISEVVNPNWVVSFYMPKAVFLKEGRRLRRISEG